MCAPSLRDAGGTGDGCTPLSSKTNSMRVSVQCTRQGTPVHQCRPPPLPAGSCLSVSGAVPAASHSGRAAERASAVTCSCIKPGCPKNFNRVAASYQPLTLISSRSRAAEPPLLLPAIKMASPSVSMPALPARPAICLYLVASMMLSFQPTYACLKITRRAGRLTPAANVEVAHRTEMAPEHTGQGQHNAMQVGFRD